MKVLLFGGSGMIGQGVLRECLQRPEITQVISVGRTPLEQKHPKLEELLRQDLYDWSGCEAQLTGIDAVFFCLGVSVYCFRPGCIQPMDGIVSKTPSYRLMYKFTGPLYPLFKGLKSAVTSTRQLGFAMVEVALRGYPKPILESTDINSVK